MTTRASAPTAAIIAPATRSHAASSGPAKSAIAVAAARQLTSTASRRAHAPIVIDQPTSGQYSSLTTDVLRGRGDHTPTGAPVIIASELTTTPASRVRPIDGTGALVAGQRTTPKF